MSGARIYIAGPAVFEPDMGKAHYDAVRELLARHGVVALTPLDSCVTTALDIRAKNIALIRECDAVIADLSPFRSLEPDCGTAFEVGYAAALGKMVLTYTRDRRTLVQKYGSAHDDAGLTVEDFGLPFNLMLYDGVPVFDSFAAAFDYFLTTHKRGDTTAQP